MNTYDDEHQRTLLQVAGAAIGHGFRHPEPPRLDVSVFAPLLCEQRATFVTLKRHNQLRGCIGALEPRWALVQDVAIHAFAAAFGDPRFAPLRSSELDDLHISIAILSPAQPMQFRDESDLLAQMRPHLDGLVLEEPRTQQRGTFLPAVWGTLPSPRQFLTHLKEKAGLPADYWSPTLRVLRYTTQEVGQDIG